MSSTDPDPVERLYARAARHGIPMAAICRHANVAVTTPSRWKNERNGANLGTLNKLDASLTAILAERAGVAA